MAISRRQVEGGRGLYISYAQATFAALGARGSVVLPLQGGGGVLRNVDGGIYGGRWVAGIWDLSGAGGWIRHGLVYHMVLWGMKSENK
jgi:hypothetical protein